MDCEEKNVNETKESTYNIEEIVKELNEEGVVVLKNVYTIEQIAEFRAEYERLWAHLQEQMNVLERKERTYLSGYQNKFQLLPVYYYENTEILQLANGRYDFSYGMYENVFEKEEYHAPEPIKTLMKLLLKNEYDYITGALPSTGKSSIGNWHRDIYSLFDDEKIDISLPDFYFTLLIPLVEVNHENGATEFIKKSHKYVYDDIGDFEKFWPSAQPGDLVLFNGKVFHRGRENLSDSDRPVLYIVYKKKWFNDY